MWPRSWVVQSSVALNPDDGNLHGFVTKYSKNLNSNFCFPWQVNGKGDDVMHLSLEAASSLQIVPSSLPVSVAAGYLIEAKVVVVDERGHVVVGGQRERFVSVSTLLNGTSGMTGTLSLPVVRGCVYFTDISFSYLSSEGVLLAFSDSLGGLRTQETGNAIIITPGDSDALEIFDRPQGVYPAMHFITPLRVRIRDVFANIVYNDFWTIVTVSIQTWDANSSHWIDAPHLLAGTLQVAVSGGVAEFSHVTILRQPQEPFQLSLNAFGIATTILSDLIMSTFADSELVIHGFEQRAWTSGLHIGTVSVSRVARLTPGGVAHLLTGDNASVISFDVVAPRQWGPVTKVYKYEPTLFNTSADYLQNCDIHCQTDMYCYDVCVRLSGENATTFSRCLFGCKPAEWQLVQRNLGFVVFGTVSVPMIGGSAVFSDISVLRAARGYTLVFSDSARMGADGKCASTGVPLCVDFDVLPGAATTLTIDPPSVLSAFGGHALNLQPIVTVSDISENVVEDRSHQLQVFVTMSPLDAEVQATLEGRTLVQTQSGQAVFTDLNVGSVGNYKLTFSAENLNLTTATRSLSVSAGAPAKLFVVKQPGNGTSALPFADQPVIGFMDQGSNVVTRNSGLHNIDAWLERTWPLLDDVLVSVSEISVLQEPEDVAHISGLLHWNMEGVPVWAGITTEISSHSFVLASQRMAENSAHALMNMSIFRFSSGHLQLVTTLLTHGVADVAHFTARDVRGIESHYLVVAQVPADSPAYNTADFRTGYHGQILGALSDHSSLFCSSSSISGPACEIVFSKMSLVSDTMSLTIAVTNTDFNELDEFVSAVYIGDTNVGGPYLVSDGEDFNCARKSVIIHSMNLSADSISASGELKIRIETSSAVGGIECNGETLHVEATISWSSTKVYRFEPTPFNTSVDHLRNCDIRCQSSQCYNICVLTSGENARSLSHCLFRCKPAEWQLVHVQDLKTYNAVRLKTFEMGGTSFLAIASQGDKTAPAESQIFQWNAVEGRLDWKWSAETHLATSWEHFRVGSRDFVAVVNSFNFSTASSNSTTAVYEWDGSSFVYRWSLSSQAASEVFAFEMSSSTYLLIANNGDRNHGTSLVRYDAAQDNFVTIQLLPVRFVYRMASFISGGSTWIVVATRDALAGPGNVQLFVETCGENSTFLLQSNDVSCHNATHLTMEQVQECCVGTNTEQRHLRHVTSLSIDSQRGLAAVAQFGKDPHYVITASRTDSINVRSLFAEEKLLGSFSSASNATQLAFFTDLAVLKKGKYLLQFSVSLLRGAISLPFEIVSGPGFRLYIVQTLDGAKGGAAFESQPHLGVQDHGDNSVSNLNFTVTATLLIQGVNASGAEAVLLLVNMSSESPGAVLQQATAQGLNGKARFEQIGINLVGANYSLLFLAPGLISVTTDVFAVSPGPPVVFEIAQHPSGATGGLPFLQQPQLILRDRGGNTAQANARMSASAEIWKNPSSIAKLAGTLVVQTSGSFVEFTDLSISLFSHGYSLLFVVRAVNSSGTRENAGPMLRARYAGGSLSNPFAVTAGPAVGLSVTPDLLAQGLVSIIWQSEQLDVYGLKSREASATVTLLQSRFFAEAVQDMNLVFLDPLNRKVLSKPIRLFEGIYGLDELGDVTINITDVDLACVNLSATLQNCDIHCQTNIYCSDTCVQSSGESATSFSRCLFGCKPAEWQRFSNLTYEVRLHAGNGSLILSGTTLQEAAHGKYEIHGYDFLDLPVYVQKPRGNLYLGGAKTCVDAECDATSNILSTVSGVYVPLDAFYHGFPVYRKGIFVLYHADLSIEPVWRVSEMEYSSSDPSAPLTLCDSGDCAEPSNICYDECMTSSGESSDNFLECSRQCNKPNVLSIFSSSIAPWAGTHRLFLDAVSQEWRVHREPDGVEAGFVGDASVLGPLHTGVLDNSHSLVGDVSTFRTVSSSCGLCEIGTPIRKHMSQFWFSVEKGTFDTVMESCKEFGGDLASIHSDLDAQIARDACLDEDCYIGLVGNASWTDGSLATYDRRTPADWIDQTTDDYGDIVRWILSGSDGRRWKRAGSGSQMFRGLCTVPELGDCAQCGALILRSDAGSSSDLRDVISWAERKGSRFVTNDDIRLSRAPVVAVVDAGGNLARNDPAVSHVSIALLSLDPILSLDSKLSIGALALKNVNVLGSDYLVITPPPPVSACNTSTHVLGCPLEYASDSVMMSWRWHAGHTAAHVKNGNFFFGTANTSTGAQSHLDCPMHWQCSGRLEAFTDLEDVLHDYYLSCTEIGGISPIVNVAGTIHHTNSITSSPQQCCPAACLQCGGTQCANPPPGMSVHWAQKNCCPAAEIAQGSCASYAPPCQCIAGNSFECRPKDKSAQDFEPVVFPTSESLFAADTFGALPPKHAGVKCHAGATLSQVGVKGAAAGDMITWEMSAGLDMTDANEAMSTTFFNVRMNGVIVVGPLTPQALKSGVAMYTFHYSVPDDYDTGTSNEITMTVEVVSDAPFLLEPTPTIVFGSLRVVNHISHIPFESLEVYEPARAGIHDENLTRVLNTNLLGSYSKSDLTYGSHPVYCRRFSDTQTANSDLSDITTAYLVYSKGLWIVTSASTAKNLPTSPLLVTSGTPESIAGTWRELTPYEISKGAITNTAMGWQFNLETPLPIFLHSLVHFAPDQVPGFGEISGRVGANTNDSDTSSLAQSRQCADWYPRCASNVMQMTRATPSAGGYLSVKSSSSLNLTRTSFSWAFWANRATNLSGLSDQSQYVISQDTAAAPTFESQQLRIGFTQDSTFTFAFDAFGTSAQSTTSATAPTSTTPAGTTSIQSTPSPSYLSYSLQTAPYPHDSGVWIHWAGSYDKVTGKRIIYRNGVAVASDRPPSAYWGSGEYFHIGKALNPMPLAASGDDVSYYEGRVDDVILLTRALTNEEVRLLFER